MYFNEGRTRSKRYVCVRGGEIAVLSDGTRLWKRKSNGDFRVFVVNLFGRKWRARAVPDVTVPDISDRRQAQTAPTPLAGNGTP